MRLPFSFWGIAILLVTAVSCTKEKPYADDPGENPAAEQKPDVSYNVNVGVMLDMVNKVRVAGCVCGATVMPSVPALTWNEQLAKAAFGHSEDMNVADYFSHTGTGNTTPGERIKSAGYNWRTYGENIALGQTTEQMVMESWLKSEGHCKNIMGKNFKEIGVGRSGNYWTQVFAAK